MSKDISYALNEIFVFFASSERSILNMITRELMGAMSDSSDISSYLSLISQNRNMYYSRVLEKHVYRSTEFLTFQENNEEIDGIQGRRVHP